MVKQRKRILAGVAALGAMVTSTLTATIAPVQAKPSTGALIIGGLAAYGMYSASKHHRNDDNRERYGYSYGGRYQGERHGDYESEHHNGYGNNGYYGGGYNHQPRRSERYDQHHRGYSGSDSHYSGNSGYSNRNNSHHRRNGYR